MKKNTIIILLIISIVLVSCSSGEQPRSSQLDTETKSINHWAITILTMEITDDLSGTQSVVQYGGDTIDVEYNEKPASGNSFVLLDMRIEKTETGQGKYSWANAYLMDADGTHYSRHANDTFLTNFNLPRIKSTDLVFGKNEGFVCFEIPAGKAAGGLTFIYEDEGESIEITLN